MSKRKIYTSNQIVMVESQKGAITIQECSVENQKGAITIDIWTGDSWFSTKLSIDSALLALNWQYSNAILNLYFLKQTFLSHFFATFESNLGVCCFISRVHFFLFYSIFYSILFYSILFYSTVKSRPEAHMDMILFEVFLKNIHLSLIPQDQIVQLQLSIIKIVPL